MLRFLTALPFSLIRPSRRWIVVGALALPVILLWWTTTPPGLLGKADAVGYAICHRIDLRSFHLGERQLPLCARCSGIYLGVLVSIGGMLALGRGRAAGLPPRPVALVLLAFVGAMGVDGVNSLISLVPGAPLLYPPDNTLRLITGTLHGLAMGAFLFPVFNQTLWREWDDRRGLGGLDELVGVLLAAAVVIGLVRTENPIVLYPLALLSTAGVLVMLAMVDTTLLLLVLRRENRAEGWRDAALPAALGLALAVAQIGLADGLRYWLTGTWAGFSL